MHCQNNLNVIIDKYVSDISTSTYERISSYQRFKSLNNVISSLEKFESVSGVVMKHSPNRIHIVHEDKDSNKLHRIVFHRRDRFLKSNLWYYSIDMKTKPNYIFTDYKSMIQETQEIGRAHV